jgi:SAM-dependent methyltransferase
MEPDAAIFYRSCNFCGAQDFRLFRVRDLPFPQQLYGDLELSCPDVGQALKLQYLECVDCGLIGVNPLTFFSDIDRRSFDGEPDLGTETRVAWTGFDYEWYEKGKIEITAYYNQYFSLDRFRRLNRILDVSCGPAITLNWLATHENWKVSGVDPDRHSVREALSRYGISITNGLIDDVNEPNESFDIVWMDNSLEHTFDPLGTMLSAFRLLRKGGAFLIAVPNGEALSVKFLDEHMLWGHWFLYSPLTISRMLTRIGFTVTKLNAVQTEVNPHLKEHGVDTDAILPTFHVVVPGRRSIEHVLSHTPCYSDFFTMLAIKPEDAPEVSPHESELRGIATGSLQHRKAVTLCGTPKDPGPDLAEPGILIAGLEGRLIRQPDTASDSGKVYFVENGIRRWVLSRKWLDAQGFWYPDDVTVIRPELFSLLQEGPEIAD